VFALKQPILRDVPGVCSPPSNSGGTIDVLEPGQSAADCETGYSFSPGYKETFLGNSAKPRLSVGVGFNWVSPFGPLRVDVARAILKQDGDDTKFFNFNVGTQF
jgi:outer membrane protein insertion porin family